MHCRWVINAATTAPWSKSQGEDKLAVGVQVSAKSAAEHGGILCWILFGGYNGTRLNDTWVWNGDDWQQLFPTISPTGRFSEGIAYDEARRKVVIFGGQTDAGGYSGDTWLWDGTTTNWMKAETVGPSARGFSAMGYDPIRQKVLLYGGQRPEGGYLSDLWTWDGANWSEVSPKFAPPPRHQACMAYDSRRKEFVMSGGGGKPVSIGGQAGVQEELLNDSWAWNGTKWRFLAGSPFFMDLGARRNGAWNFTTVNIPSGQTVKFFGNIDNVPIRFLVVSNVTIAGTLDLSGEPGQPGGFSNRGGTGGPGGFAGGKGGVPISFPGDFLAGYPGLGPGGGLPAPNASVSGKRGNYASV